jgi:hypothetical protein
MGNQSGQAYAFMSMTPILPGKEDEVEQHIASWPSGENSPIARMGSTHFARFLVLRDLVFEGEPQERDSLQSAYVVFVTNFDGELEDYLLAMLDLMPEQCEQAWGECVGCPPVSEQEDFIAYLVHNQIDTTFFASAYPDATVKDVHESVALRRKVSDLAVAGQALSSEELMARWRSDFGTVTA